MNLGTLSLVSRSWITTSAVELNFSGVFTSMARSWGRKEKEDVWMPVALQRACHILSRYHPAPTCLASQFLCCQPAIPAATCRGHL